jgi:hypothetical protein
MEWMDADCLFDGWMDGWMDIDCLIDRLIDGWMLIV